MTEWRKVKLGDICSIKSGKRLPKGADFSSCPTVNKYIRARDIKNGVINGEDLAFISNEVKERISKYIVNTNDVIVTIAGTIGEVAFVTSQYDGVNLTENAIRLTDFDHEVNSKYVFYTLRSNDYYEHMQKIAGGAAQPKMGIYKVEAISIALPSVDTQERIVDILSRYDALIENYQRQIKLLEEAAQRLYKEWFVDLRFPGHQSSPIINNLPQGWQKKKLGEIVKTTSGGTPSRGRPEYYTGDILWVKTKELNDSFILDTEEKISIEAINKSSAKILPSGSLLLAMYGATIGKLGIASKELACNQACCVFLFDDNDVFRWFLYNWLIFNRSFLISQGKGAAQPNLSQDMIKNFEAIIPDTPLLEKFNHIVNPLYERIKNAQIQIRNLSEARDRLLPKLMSAEIINIEDYELL